MATEVSLTERHEHTDSARAGETRLNRANGEITLLDLLIVLAECKRTVLSITGSFAVIAIVVSLLLPKRYTATASLLPPQQSSSVSTMFASQLGSLGGMAAMAGGGLGLKNPNDMYVAMMRSRTVEDAMVQRFGLVKEYRAKHISDARKALESKAIVDGSGKDGLIHISVTDGDPKLAAEIANGYIDQFRKFSEGLAITEASQRRLFFDQQLVQAKDNLANAEESMKEMQQKTGMIQLDSQTRALIESASTLRAQIAAKEVEINSMQAFATDQNAQLMQAQRELGGLRAQLAKLGGTETGDDSSLLLPKGRVPEAGLEYVRKVRDVKYYETIFDIMARQFEMAKLDEAKQGAIIQVIDSAVPPETRSFPQRALIVVGATLAGFLVSIFVVLTQFWFRRMKETPETARKLSAFLGNLSFKHPLG